MLMHYTKRALVVSVYAPSRLGAYTIPMYDRIEGKQAMERG